MYVLTALLILVVKGRKNSNKTNKKLSFEINWANYVGFLSYLL